MVLGGLLLILFIPSILLLSPFKKSAVYGVLCAVAVIFLLVGVLTLHNDERRPAQNIVHYGLNMDTKKAVFWSTDKSADSFTEQYLGKDGPKGSIFEFNPEIISQVLKSDAPSLAIDPPMMEVLSDDRANGERALSLKITSPREAGRIVLYMPGNIKITGAILNDKPYKILVNDERQNLEPYTYNIENLTLLYGKYRVFQYYGLPSEGVTFAVKFKDEGPVDFRLVDISYGLPDIFSKPRPKDMTYNWLPGCDLTYLSKEYKF
jgi:hypothetical protein